MIVRGLTAEGFMRFERLELKGLPRGVIGVVGENEAGKTSIGEAIAFALFGRTIRTEDTDPAQAIHWEADACRTSIDVEVVHPGPASPHPPGTYRVQRLVARTGEFEARLFGPLSGSQAPELASEPREVSAALSALLGIDFSTFRYSFYVAQRELDLVRQESHDNARRIVYDMLGITTIERARARLEEAVAELRERAETLERDLVVANALHTEALPARDEVEAHERAVVASRDGLAAAAKAEVAADDAARAGRALADAQRDTLAALGRVEGALVAAGLRQGLLRIRERLETLVERDQEQLAKHESVVVRDEAPRKQVSEALEKALAIRQHLQALEKLVKARRTQLTAQVTEGGADTLHARAAREADVAAREGRTARVRLLGLLFALLLTLASAGAAAATRLPAGAPLLRLPAQALVIPGLEASVQFSVNTVTYLLGGLAGLFLVWAAVIFRSRSQAVQWRERALGEGKRLVAAIEAARVELAACEAFQPAPLSGIAAGVESIPDGDVREAFEALKAVAGDELASSRSADEVLNDARERTGELQSALRLAEPQLIVARRLEDTARKQLARVQEVLARAFPQGAPEAHAGAPWPAPPDDLGALADELDALSADVVRAKVELEALAAAGRDGPVSDATRALREALVRAFAAVPDAKARKGRYEDHTGLPELLKPRAEPASADDVRSIFKRERELVVEVLGADEALERAARAAEAELRAARDRAASAQAELEDLKGRGIRIEAARARIDELEAKIAGLHAALGPTRHALDVHAEAIQLMDDLVQSLRSRFGPGIARYVELVLPRITHGRYRRVRVEDDLDIRIFSLERGDFVRLVELSLGTADQVLLSLRLGLARALIASRGLAGGHFLFLDEPLVSADEEREQGFLDLLRAFDTEFTQIFVTSPRRMEAKFATRLDLSRANRVVQVGGVAPPVAEASA